MTSDFASPGDEIAQVDRVIAGRTEKVEFRQRESNRIGRRGVS